MSSPELSTPTALPEKAIRDLSAETLRKRREDFLALCDFTLGRGLEIGPLDSSISDRATDDVRYVDVFDTDAIRQHYAGDPEVDVDRIPHVDFPLTHDGRIRSLAEAAAPGAPYDWVIASHVIEHVPDVIGWLAQLAELTADGGALVLAVPDRRYCFDRHRPPTTTGQAIEAHERGDLRPTVRSVYDAFTAAVQVDLEDLWRNRRPPGRQQRIHTPDFVRDRMREARDGTYVDCHVWTWTDQELLEQIGELRRLGLCEWYVESIHLVHFSLEFHAVLRRLPRGVPLDEAVVTEPELTSDLPDWLEAEWGARNRAKRLRKKVERVRTRNQELTARVAALEASGKMRVGSAVTAPARWARRGLRRAR